MRSKKAKGGMGEIEIASYQQKELSYRRARGQAPFPTPLSVCIVSQVCSYEWFSLMFSNHAQVRVW